MEKRIRIIKTTNEIKKLMEQNNICRGELFYNEDTGEMYMVDKGDLELYWLKIGASKVMNHFEEELEKIDKKDEMKIVDEISEVGNINPVLEETLNPFLV